MENKTESTTNEELVELLQAAGQGTPEAAGIMAELWERNINLVRLTVHRLTGMDYSETGFEDIEQQAYFGFHAAAFHYSPAEGLRFSTYATNRIKWELCRYYENNGYTVRIPAFMRQRIRNGEKKRRQIEAETGAAATMETALKSLCLSPAAIASTLEAYRKMEAASLEAEAYGSSEGDSVCLLDKLADNADVETGVIGEVWQQELHELLFRALREVPEELRRVVVQHYFTGLSLSRIARESGITKQTAHEREQKAFQAIRAGRYSAELSEFCPTQSSRERAERLIKQEREAVERLRLTDDEMGLLAL